MNEWESWRLGGFRRLVYCGKCSEMLLSTSEVAVVRGKGSAINERLAYHFKMVLSLIRMLPFGCIWCYVVACVRSLALMHSKPVVMSV